jgi:hypothetical protein
MGFCRTGVGRAGAATGDAARTSTRPIVTRTIGRAPV